MGSIRSSWIVLVVTAGCLPRPTPVMATPAPPPVAVAVPPPPMLQPQPVPQPQPQPVPQPVPQLQPQPVPQPQPQPVPQPQPQPVPQPQYPPPVYAQVYAQPSPPPAKADDDDNVDTDHPRLHNAEVIVDTAVLGTLAGVDILVTQNDKDPTAGLVITSAGLVGGGAAGWLLTQHFKVDAGTAHLTTTGMLLGMMNGALLVEPTHWDNANQVLGLLLGGGAIGATGGFVLGQTTELTSGQSLFLANMVVLGGVTSGMTAVLGANADHFAGWEDATLAIGTDAGAVIGAVVAPALDWSPQRSRKVFAMTFLGALVGAGGVGLFDKPGTTNDTGNALAVALTAGMWGGFALGVLISHDAEPDIKFRPHTAPAAPHGTSSDQSSTSIVPWVGGGQDHHGLGLMAAGAF